MIRLEVPSYCENCGDFSVATWSTTKRDTDGMPVDHVTVISCKHLSKCRRAVSVAICEYKRGEKNGKTD